MKYFKTLILATIILFLTILLCTTSLVFSQEHSRTFTIVPPTIQFQVKQNDQLETKVKVRNETDNPLTFTIFIRDFIVEDKEGTPKILAPDTADNRWSASKWMAVSPDTLTIPGRSSGEAMLYIQVPGDATFGGHYTAVIFEPATKDSIGGTGASIITQSASLVYLHVLGPIKELGQITKFTAPKFSEFGPIKIDTEIANLGDLHFKPVGTVEIKDLFGRNLETLPLSEDNVFPGATRAYENVWRKKWLAGQFTAVLNATYGQTGLPLTAAVVFYVFPWKVALAIVLAIVIIILLVKYLKKNPPIGKPPPKFSQK